MIVLFPSDYYNIKTVDPDYAAEYEAVCQIPEFKPVLFNFDAFSSGEKIKLYPSDYYKEDFCIYRGWMLNPSKYEDLYYFLLCNNIGLVNAPCEYNECHLFPIVYQEIKEFTPKILCFQNASDIDWDYVNKTFERFMVKDYVKSEKGTDFPEFFTTPIVASEMNKNISKFIEMRGKLYTGGIVLKEYVKLKKYGDHTNEYRAFYLQNKLLSVCRNSNQPESCSLIPPDFFSQFSYLRSSYYTVDFAELQDEGWIILEVGDGQVSGLSPNQWPFKYYDDMRRILLEERIPENWDDIEDTLFCGTAEQIHALKCPKCGNGLRYTYCEGTRCTEISCGCTRSRGHCAHRVPNFHILKCSSTGK